MKFNELADLYRGELLQQVIPFWLEHSLDKVEGGYFTCLDRNGEVFDTDKFIWLQARQVWLFSMLYNQIDQDPAWLSCAVHGADFLEKYGHDGNFDWYFSVNRLGQPLTQPYSIFSYTFATMAFGQLYKSTNEDRYAEIAKKTFHRILEKSNDPKGIWSKNIIATRSLKNFALPMILCNLALEIEHLLDPQLMQEIINNCIHEVMEEFLRPELGGIIVENLTVQGHLHDSFDGRLINPGHAIEAMWFIMDLGKRLNRPELIDKAVQTTLTMIEYGWDKEHGGIFYFMDRSGYPPQQLEWDQKLWWVHIESLIALIKGYQLSGNKKCLDWFLKIHDYTWAHFKDPEYPEWYGYLKRTGEPLLSLKGGKWKGCFHLPRGLYQCWKILEALQQRSI